MRRLLLGIAVLCLLGCVSAPAQAAGSRVPPFRLTYEYWGKSGGTSLPFYCLHEDSTHWRIWSGGPFDGVSTATDRVCDHDADGNLTGGGVGFQVQVTFDVTTRGGGELRDLRMISPSGLGYPSSLLTTYAVDRKTTRYTYGLCVTRYNTPENYWLALEGGVWTMRFEGTFSNVTLSLDADQALWERDPQHCPGPP